MRFGDADLRVLFETGVPVTFGGTSVYADTGAPIMGLPEQPLGVRLADQGTAGVELGMPAVWLPYNAFFPMPTNGQSITVDGTAYTVNFITADEDGSIVCIELKAAS